MFCPKCSQQQVSDEVRFCSRCGFQLGVVAELLSTGGVLQTFQPQPEEKLSLYRQVTSHVGAKIVFLSLILVPVAFLIGIIFDAPEWLLLPLFLFFIGLVQIIYKQIFGKKITPEKRLNQTGNLNSSEPQFQLSSPQNAPVPILEIKNRDTAKMSPPPSVTDHTTKLLELNADSSEPKN